MMMTVILGVFYVAVMAWACLALWTHTPLGIGTYGLMGIIIILMILSIWHIDVVYKSVNIAFIKLAFWVLIGGVFMWFMMMTPSNNRIWQNEFRHQFTYQKQGNKIIIHHVRNFHWYHNGTHDTYQENWETREYDLTHLKHLDMVSTTWGNENIAHIMLSFGFENAQGDIDRLVFSVETRKEIGEDFSTVGGFFRLYDLSIIAGDELDLIYTRTNIRDEQVSIYPINYRQDKIKQLFLTYLDYGQDLNDNPKFYNSLYSNCTTVIYEMIKEFDKVPLDYRIIVSGRLANYLYEHGAIDNGHSLQDWQKYAHANPKVTHLGKNSQITSKAFSKLIRQDLPKNSH